MNESDLFKSIARAKKFRDMAANPRVHANDTLAVSRCDLCLFTRPPKAFSKQRTICLNCSMRNLKPKWLNTENALIARMRKECSLSQEELAEMCGWKKARQCRLELQSKLNYCTAMSLAMAFTKLTVQGHDTSRAASLWPAFCLLVPHEMIEAWSGTDDVLPAAETSEEHPDLG